MEEVKIDLTSYLNLIEETDCFGDKHRNRFVTYCDMLQLNLFIDFCNVPLRHRAENVLSKQIFEVSSDQMSLIKKTWFTANLQGDLKFLWSNLNTLNPAGIARYPVPYVVFSIKHFNL